MLLGNLSTCRTSIITGFRPACLAATAARCCSSVHSASGHRHSGCPMTTTRESARMPNRPSRFTTSVGRASPKACTNDLARPSARSSQREGRQVSTSGKFGHVKREPPVQQRMEVPVVPGAKAIWAGKVTCAVVLRLPTCSYLVQQRCEHRLEPPGPSQLDGVASSVLQGVGNVYRRGLLAFDRPRLEPDGQFRGLDVQFRLTSSTDRFREGDQCGSIRTDSALVLVVTRPPAVRAS